MTLGHTCQRSGISNCEPCIAWRVRLWDAIHKYVVACGGDPSGTSGARMDAVVDVEGTVVSAWVRDEVRG